jgi:hypothetical protein
VNLYFEKVERCFVRNIDMNLFCFDVPNSSCAFRNFLARQKWKAFAAEVENMTKALKKKDMKGASSSFEQAVVALDAYLEKVELPSSKEVSRS